MTDIKNDPHQAKAVALYLFFIVSAILVMSPMMAVSFIALLALLTVMAVVGFIRRDVENDSLLYNHATYISRTFWMWQLLLLIGFVLGGYYLSRQFTSMNDILYLAQSLAAGQFDSPEFRMIAMVAAAAFGPGCLYAAYRLLYGLTRAIKGYRVARPKSFF